MMLTELSGLSRVLDCSDDLIFFTLLGFAIGIALGALAYHFLKDFDR